MGGRRRECGRVGLERVGVEVGAVGLGGRGGEWAGRGEGSG